MSTDIKNVSVIGAGVIGSSWAALFLAAGKRVDIFDPLFTEQTTITKVKDYIKNAWATLEELDMTARGDIENIHFHTDLKESVVQADFVQESVPERLELKHKLFTELEDYLLPHTITASSASGLMVSEMQKGWRDPSRFILAHPFNPPHLIPLVELLANEQTADGVLETTEAFFQEVGKVTIRVQKEVPAHVANRLQAAVWREAIHLVESGVASVEDVDKAMWAGPGLRWAAMGPHMLFHLGAGEGGLNEFCNRYADSFHRWWEDLSDVRLTPELIKSLSDGVDEETGSLSVEESSALRDKLITNMLKETRQLR